MSDDPIKVLPWSNLYLTVETGDKQIRKQIKRKHRVYNNVGNAKCNEDKQAVIGEGRGWLT